GRVEDRRRGGARPRLRHRPRLDDDCPTGEEPPGGDAHQEHRQAEQEKAPGPGTLVGALGSVDAELVEAPAVGHGTRTAYVLRSCESSATPSWTHGGVARRLRRGPCA